MPILPTTPEVQFQVVAHLRVYATYPLTAYSQSSLVLPSASTSAFRRPFDSVLIYFTNMIVIDGDYKRADIWRYFQLFNLPLPTAETAGNSFSSFLVPLYSS